MNQICRDIFRAIHEGKWLKIEYRNKADQVTKYWIGIRDIDPRSRTMKVDGLHLGQLTIGEYDRIFIDSILSTEIIEGTYCPENKILVEDIEMHPERYKNIFDSSANLKILNYLEICNKLDTTPYITDYDLIHYIDRDRINGGMYQLTDQQFREVVAQFQYFSSREKRKSGSLKVKRLAINVLSINTNKGLYVLAYRNLNLDVKNHIFKPDEEITVCTQFSIDGKQENARKFLDADEYELLEDFEKNLEKIKDAITEHGGNKSIVDDKELINVATSRAKEKLVLLTNGKELERLHAGQADDDLYELAQYIKTNGHSKITEKHISSRALGIQPFSTATENAFLENLTHALENIWLSQSKYVIHKEVAISQVFRDNITYDDLFYMGRFDFVVYEKQGRSELPILAIELDGKEHFDDAVVKERDRKKNAICKAHNMEIIRVENSYARRYNHIKGILMDYFSRVH